MPDLAFVAPSSAGAGVAALAGALRAEVGRQDATARLSPEPPPGREDRVYVTFPDAGEGAPPPQPGRAIAVLLAPPGSEAFERGLEPARQAGAVFHVNSAATERLLELGVPARHLQLGHSAEWDRFDPSAGGEVELAVVRGDGYFDWPRVLEAIHAGAAVLHEDSLGQAPLVADRHLFTAAAPDLDAEAAALRDDRERLDRVRREAHEFVREALPMALAAAALIGSARMLVAQPLAAAG